MNIIEQLGGYEKASEDFKKLHLNLKEQQKSNKVFMDAFDALKTELLEYRRQHNIFEVGDAVIRKWNGRLYYLIVDIDNDGQEFLIHHDKGAKFKDCRVSDNICNFKHATPEEIKAGKRL